jgi:uncharacterized protein (TIGR00369 family)
MEAALRTRPLLRAWQVAVHDAAEATVELRMPLPADQRFDDPAHGGCDRALVVALGDAAAWLSILATMEDGAKLATLEMKVDWVVPRAAVTTLAARAEVVRRGRSLSTVRATLRSVGAAGRAENLGFIEATYIVL